MTAAQQRWSVRLSTRHWIAWAQRSPRYSRERFRAELMIRELRIRHSGLVRLEADANTVIRELAP